MEGLHGLFQTGLCVLSCNDTFIMKNTSVANGQGFVHKLTL